MTTAQARAHGRIAQIIAGLVHVALVAAIEVMAFTIAIGIKIGVIAL